MFALDARGVYPRATCNTLDTRRVEVSKTPVGRSFGDVGVEIICFPYAHPQVSIQVTSVELHLDRVGGDETDEQCAVRLSNSVPSCELDLDRVGGDEQCAVILSNSVLSFTLIEWVVMSSVQ